LQRTGDEAAAAELVVRHRQQLRMLNKTEWLAVYVGEIKPNDERRNDHEDPNFTQEFYSTRLRDATRIGLELPMSRIDEDISSGVSRRTFLKGVGGCWRQRR
jgi:hypothetical protein